MRSYLLRYIGILDWNAILHDEAVHLHGQSSRSCNLVQHWCNDGMRQDGANIRQPLPRHKLASVNRMQAHAQEVDDDWEKVSKQVDEANKLNNHANHGPLEKDEKDAQKEHDCAPQFVWSFEKESDC